ncbi:MAG: dihydrolipoamide acetyltransferase family protein [Chloroflexota bacterium]
MAEFRMPSLGADMEAGTLVEWLVKPGDEVKRGDIIAVVETAKGVVDVEIYEDGVVEELVVEPYQKVPVGTVLATIAGEGEAEPAATRAAPVPQATPAAAPEPATVARATAVAEPAGGERVRVSPLARRVAQELGVDLTTVAGSGPHGAIQRADVERAAQAAAEVPPRAVEAEAPRPAEAEAPKPEPARPAPAEAKPEPGAPDFQTAMRQAIAAAMARANREIPHYYLETHVDMTAALEWLEAENSRRSIKERLLPVVLLIKATARALEQVPELNGYWLDDRHQPQEAIHIGFAISLRQGGLVTPAIHHADQKSLDDLMENVRDLITRTRAGRLRSSELTDATVTLTSLGDLGVEKVFGVIYPPQLALVGFGRVVQQPRAVDGLIGIRPMISATLAADHRATDGHRGGQFLDALDHCLQQPESL